MPKRSTTVSTTNNCLEFESGDFKISIPEEAMSDGFKVALGITTGISVATMVIICICSGYKTIRTEITEYHKQYSM